MARWPKLMKPHDVGYPGRRQAPTFPEKIAQLELRRAQAYPKPGFDSQSQPRRHPTVASRVRALARPNQLPSQAVALVKVDLVIGFNYWLDDRTPR
jgi:hypothetical protein